MLRQYLPNHICDQLPCPQSVMNPAVPDRQIWRLTSTGKFTVASASRISACTLPKWRFPFIWKLKLPPRIQIFVWLTAHQRLLTNVLRKKWFSSDSDVCPLCHNAAETIEHALRSCPSMLQIWFQLDPPAITLQSFTFTFEHWFSVNMQSTELWWAGLNWSYVFSTMTWWIWKWRCSTVFMDSFHLPVNIKNYIYFYTQEWAHNANLLSVSSHVSLRWEPLEAPLLKMNVDAGADTSGGWHVAGVLRDSTGRWMLGFHDKVVAFDVLGAEMLAVFTGLRLLFMANYVNIIIESDSQLIINLLNSATIVIHPLLILIQRCKELLTKFQYCRLLHISRLQNALADSMVQYSKKQYVQSQYYYNVPVVFADVYFSELVTDTMIQLVPSL